MEGQFLSALEDDFIENDSQSRFRIFLGAGLRLGDMAYEFGIVPGHDLAVRENIGKQLRRYRIAGLGLLRVDRL